MNEKSCTHGPGQHRPRPFWFADRVDDSDAPWRAFIQLNGCVDNLDTGFRTEADCLDYIRDEILKATTACDD